MELRGYAGDQVEGFPSWTGNRLTEGGGTVGVISKIFYQTVASECGFLGPEYGFEGPFSDFEICEEHYVYKIWFMGRTLAIEFVLDQRDEDVSCLIVRLENGQLPSGLYVNEQGERVRVYFMAWLESTGFKGDFINYNPNELRNKDFGEKIKMIVRNYARSLQAHGGPVLRDRADEVFRHVSGRLAGLQSA
jgi:hypothetical protein